jgi:hypothetical protein
MRSSLLLLLLAALPACSGRQISAPEPPVAGSAADASFFVLQSSEDRRLPAPGHELDTATASELAAIAVDQAQYALTPDTQSADPHPTLFWNALTRQLATGAAQPPPMFARSYTLVHVAIYDALRVTQHRRRSPMPAHAVAAGAAFEVLSYLFPASAATVQRTAREQAELRSVPALAGWLVGRAVGCIAVAWARTDGSNAVYSGTPPTGPGLWTGTNPVLPMCGTWRTWIVRSGSEIMPQPPYPFGSPADLADVDAVYEASLQRTAEQIAIVHKWADQSPPAIWNGLLTPRLLAAGLDELASARALAYLNATMYDGFVTCWQCKYMYWIARPLQRIPGLVTVVPTPNFPGYTSGHSTISAAAAAVMCELFSSETNFFMAQASEAAISRFWGGIHFNHDNEQGLEVGERIGAKAVARMRHDGFVTPLPRLARVGGRSAGDSSPVIVRYEGAGSEHSEGVSIR